MVANFKIVVESNNETKRTFIIRPYLPAFDNFKDEIFMRMPQLKEKPLEYHYEGQLVVFHFFCFSLNICVISVILNYVLKRFFFIDAEGDQITIFNELDFEIFLEQKINKMFVAVPSESGTSLKQRSIEIEPKRILNQNELKVLRDRHRNERMASAVRDSFCPKSSMPSTSKLNDGEGVSEQTTTTYGKMINEKLTEPMRDLSVRSNKKMLQNLLASLEPSHDRGTFTLNLE